MLFKLVDLDKSGNVFAMQRYDEDTFRCHCVIQVKKDAESDEVVDLHFYRSSGTNSKTYDGKKVSHDEIKGKWLLVFGVTDYWIHKTGLGLGKLSAIVERLSSGIEKRFSMKEATKVTVDMNDEIKTKINSIQKVEPFCPGMFHLKMKRAEPVVTVNFYDKIDRLEKVLK